MRTPLTTIGGYADLLAQGFAGELTDRQKEPMAAIQSASSHLAKLIDDILDVAAIDAGQLELDLGDVNLEDVVREAAELVAAEEGIGKMITTASKFQNTDSILLGVIIIGLVGFGIDMLMRWAERSLVPWKGKG